ncbi:ABC transporter permease [Kaistia sp. MMO-174]|uniref:ABC transporter permease n=1 Tax=Kaistia sp. MMO-174 TaxID=3081256 RepID=UPI001ACED2E3|nr:ABC transporter permease [Hyphomicrobiales bacterium]
MMRASTKAIPFLLPATLLSAVVFLLPFVWLVYFSFKTQPPGSLLLGEGFSLANYRRLFADPFFFQAIGRTVLLSAVSTALCLVIGLPVARLIATGSGRAKGLLLALLLVPLVSGALLPSLGMIHLLGPLGVVNGTLKMLGLVDSSVKFLGTTTGVIIGMVQAFLPLMVLPLVNTLSRLPTDLESAARSLGAPPVAVWRRVVLPLAAPGIKAGSVLVFCAAFTSFVTPQVMGQGKIATFGTVAFQQASLVLDWPFASTLAVVVLVALGLAFLISARLGRTTRRTR